MTELYAPLSVILPLIVLATRATVPIPVPSEIGLSYMYMLFNSLSVSVGLNISAVGLYLTATGKTSTAFLTIHNLLFYVFLSLTLFFQSLVTYYPGDGMPLSLIESQNFAIILLTPVCTFNLVLLPLYTCLAPLASMLTIVQ